MPSGEHNAGRDCIGCHEGDGPSFTIAGTAYQANGTTAAAGATIVVEDAAGKLFNLVTASNGNFYTTQSVRFPVKTYGTKCPDVAEMVSSVTNGSCNTCHGSSMRITIP